MHTFASLIFVAALAAPLAHAAPQGHKLLFAGITGVSDTDQRAIFRALGYRVAPGGKALADPDCGEIPHEVRLLDLNGDTVPEVIVVAGNACTSGHAGASVNLFVKGAGSAYVRQLGFPGSGIEPLATRTRGYADLKIEGPDACQPVWAWTGKAYDFKCGIETEPRACSAAGRASKICKR